MQYQLCWPWPFLAVLFFAAVVCTHAQEVRVPVDEEGKVEHIDRVLEEKLGIFPEYESFQDAALYQLPDSSFVLEVFYQPEGKVTKNRRVMSAAEVATFRRRVSQAILDRSPQTTLDQTGRARLITGTTVLGLGYYGWAVPLAAGVEETKTAVALYMLTAGSSFFIPYLVTANSQVTKAQANLSLYGAAAGVFHGYLLYGLLNDGDIFDLDTKGAVATSLLTGVAEGIAGAMIAGGNNLGEGKTNVITGVGTIGLGAGAAIAYLSGFEKPPGYAGVMLLGTGIGFFAGNTIANLQHYTAGDATVLNTVGVLGAYAPAALLYTAVGDGNDNDRKLYVGTALAATVVGLYVGHKLVEGHEFTDAQGDYIALSTLATGALGVGIAYLVTTSDPNAKVYFAASSLGAVGGFALMYSLLEDKARTRHDEGCNWQIELSPTGLASLVLGIHTSNTSVSIPVVVANVRF